MGVIFQLFPVMRGAPLEFGKTGAFQLYLYIPFYTMQQTFKKCFNKFLEKPESLC